MSYISAGGYHTCGILQENSTLRCYASPSFSMSYAGYDEAGKYTLLSSGGGHTCAQHANGSIACFGSNLYQQSSVPASVSGAVQLSSGAYHTMAVLQNGSLVVWGGFGTELGQSSFPRGNAWKFVDVLFLHACGITTDGKLLCWGQDTNGSVNQVPQRITAWLSVATGGYFTCGLTAERVALCWGNNDQGQLNSP
jgi:alpha-tubulin suppressor-like RCC1 family protein